MKGVSQRKDTRRGIANLWERELGSIAPRTFADSVRASEGIVRSLGFERALKQHRGCVNTLCFNTDGSILLSGSDDRQIILWNWRTGSSKFTFHTGHDDNILHAQFMPWSNDSSVITCSADGQVRHVHLSGCATLSVLAKELGRVHRMALEPGSANTFYSCSQNGFVTHFDLRTNKPTNFTVVDSSLFMVELYAIAIDPTNPYSVAVGGSEEFTRIYDIRKWSSSDSTLSDSLVGCLEPTQLSHVNAEGITGLAYSNTGELLVSYCCDDIYLFPREQVQLLQHRSSLDNSDRSEPNVYTGHSNERTVKGVYFLGPGCEYVASGSDSGHAFIWRKRDGEILRALKGDRYVVNSIEPHPLVPVLATSGLDKDVKMWAPQSFEPEYSKGEVDMVINTVVSTSSSDDDEDDIYSEFGYFYDIEDGDDVDDSNSDDDDHNDNSCEGDDGGHSDVDLMSD